MVSHNKCVRHTDGIATSQRLWHDSLRTQHNFKCGNMLLQYSGSALVRDADIEMDK